MEEFSFGLFDDLLEGEQHPLQIDDWEDEEELKRKFKDSQACIYTPVEGETELHRAIRSGNQIKINVLLEVYKEDFEKVRHHLQSKHQWDLDDKIWFRKTILVAINEEQCRTAKSLEGDQIEAEDIRQAIFVLLKHPVNGEEVAVLHPTGKNRLPAAELIRTLTPNGFLSWNYVGTEGKRETFMELAASCGLTSMIDRLYELGAEIAIPGHNPLMNACRTNKLDLVRRLLTEHFDHFDCTLRDGSQNNILVVAMQRNNTDLFDFILEKMMAYRQKYYGETENEAFDNIFKFECDDLESFTIFSFLRKDGPLKQSVESALVRYKFNLSYRWKSVTVLGCMIEQKIALDYCFEGIRNDPKLLGLVEYERITILHKLLKWGYFNFLCEMYQKNPAVKSHFNTDGGLETLHRAFSDQNREAIQFMLEHHEEFIKSDLEKLKDTVVCCKYYSKEYYEQRYPLFSEFFPDLQKDIVEVLRRAVSSKYYQGLEKSFAELSINLSELENLQSPPNTVRGSNGETLLHLAVEKDDQELVLRLLEAGCNIDALDNSGNHVVHFVQRVAMLNLLMERHPEGQNLVHQTNQDGYSVLHKVCSLYTERKPLIELLERVIDCGANVHQLTNKGESAVFHVWHCSLLDVLRKHNVQLDVVSNDGETALQRHLCNHNQCMARPLFSYVHDLPSFKDHAHKYLGPMMHRNRDSFSCNYQDLLELYPEATRLMFDAVYEHSREEASRLFAKACGSAFVYVAEMFLEGNYDLDFNYKDEYEYTPIVGLLSYMERSNIHIVKQLLAKGVDLRARNNWGRDALLSLVWGYRSAKWYGHGVDTVQLLLDHGAPINTTDLDGNTPLHLAFKHAEWELVEVLIQNGAELKALNNNGKTPLQMASAVDQELFYFWS